jgi:hypothetical protein
VKTAAPPRSRQSPARGSSRGPLLPGTRRRSPRDSAPGLPAGRQWVLWRQSVCAERCAELASRGDAELGEDPVEVGCDRACERYSRAPMSRLVRPAAASWAIWSSCAVRLSRASGSRRRLDSPDARNSRRARSLHEAHPRASKVSRAARSGARESAMRRCRRSHWPCARSRRARWKASGRGRRRVPRRSGAPPAGVPGAFAHAGWNARAAAVRSQVGSMRPVR